MFNYIFLHAGMVMRAAMLAMQGTGGDPDNGVAAGTKFEDVPEDWVCPICGAGKEDFVKEN